MWCSKTAPTASRKVKYWPFSKRPSSHFIIIILITIDDEALLLVGGTEARPASPFPSQGLHLLQGGHFSGFGPNPGEAGTHLLLQATSPGPTHLPCKRLFCWQGSRARTFWLFQALFLWLSLVTFSLFQELFLFLAAFSFFFSFSKASSFCKDFCWVGGRKAPGPATNSTYVVPSLPVLAELDRCFSKRRRALLPALCPLLLVRLVSARRTPSRSLAINLQAVSALQISWRRNLMKGRKDLRPEIQETLVRTWSNTEFAERTQKLQDAIREEFGEAPT